MPERSSGRRFALTGVSTVALQTVKGNQLPNAPRNKIALNGNYTFVFDKGSLTLSATGIWRDQQYGAIFKEPYNVAPSWSQVDLRATWKAPDDKYEIILYGRNVFNTVGYEAAAGGGIISTNRLSRPTPRTICTASIRRLPTGSRCTTNSSSRIRPEKNNFGRAGPAGASRSSKSLTGLGISCRPSRYATRSIQTGNRPSCNGVMHARTAVDDLRPPCSRLADLQQVVST